MKTFLIFLLISIAVSEGLLNPSICSSRCVHCIDGRCMDSIPVRAVRSSDCGTCPPDTYCSNGECIGFPWPSG
ncbi:hypothetical protein L5515_004379 [Caenorhabditis briggsae]|uniref:4Fe-4S ferredoxin-type domain-containing protein n=1 Tax=Caenorhabditis briggsae TaxID=6238 RepID=A0AAE9ENN2_CAEBR|nr:hypothetical protein L5515_004379 [Caenorhabditis briggsae]